MTDERTRHAILARRAKFLAAAIAATLPACDREKEGIAPDHPTTHAIPDAGAPVATSPPRDAAVAAPCLEIAEPTDAGPADVEPPPMPCLKIAPPKDAGPKPHPCLKVAPDD